jgi:hypothetical protein
MNIKLLLKTWRFVFFTILILFLQSNVHATEIDFIQHVDNSDVLFTIRVSEVEKLAGLKISATYPEQLMLYSESIRTAETSSFMHVVNDKNPGKLIIVMASAKGITGENIPLLKLRFKILNPENFTQFLITPDQCQLMDEHLNEIKCSIK